MPETPVEGLHAVYPGGAGRIIHMYDPRWRSVKPRPDTYPSSVCGVPVSLVTGSHSWRRLTGRVMLPFATAVELERRPPVPQDDPRPRFPEERRFCGKCVGMWVERHRLINPLLDLIVEKTRSKG